jgi:hypothetical protein
MKTTFRILLVGLLLGLPPGLVRSSDAKNDGAA